MLKNKKKLFSILCTICLAGLASYYFYHKAPEQPISTGQRHLLVIGKDPVGFADHHLNFLQDSSTSFWYVSECHEQPTPEGKLGSTHIKIAEKADVKSLNRIISSLKEKKIVLNAILTEQDERLCRLAADLRTQHNIAGTKYSDMIGLPKADSLIPSLAEKERYEVDLVVLDGKLKEFSVKSITIADLDPSKSWTCTTAIDVVPATKQSVRVFVEGLLKKWNYKNGGLSLSLHATLQHPYKVVGVLPYTDTLKRQMHQVNSGVPCTISHNPQHYQAVIAFANGYDGTHINPAYRQVLAFCKDNKLDNATVKRKYPTLQSVKANGSEIEYDPQHGSHIALSDRLEVTCTHEDLSKLTTGVAEIRKDMGIPFAGIILKKSFKNGQIVYEKTTDKDHKDIPILLAKMIQGMLSIGIVSGGLVVIGFVSNAIERQGSLPH